MKKIFIPLMAIAMMSLFASCNNVESKADEYVKEEMEAASSLNFSKAKEIDKEAKEYREGLSDEDKEKFDAAVLEATAKYEKEFAKQAEKVGKALGGALEGLDEINKSVDEITSDEETSTDDEYSNDDKDDKESE